jgi:type II secretory pathway pseudopilin PulG
MKRARPDAGFALAALICFLTAAAVATAVVLPLRVMQTRRQTEEELIFRGQEYIRAIQKYQRKYGIYPSSVDDLISRDGLRFLRRQYKDPITGEDFRLINVNADGSLTGSLTMLTVPISNQTNTVPGSLPAGAGPAAGGGGGTGGNAGGGSRGGGTGAGATGSSSTGSIAGFGANMGVGNAGGQQLLERSDNKQHGTGWCGWWRRRRR